MVQVPGLVAGSIALCSSAAVLHFLHSRNFHAQVELLAAFHFGLGVITLFSTLFFTAPYGRHAPTSSSFFFVSAKLAWVVQELPTLLNVVVMYYSKLYSLDETQPQGFLSVFRLPILLYSIHYIHRTFIFPFVIRPRNDMPLHVMLLACVYCSFNGFLQSASNLASNAGTPSVYAPMANDWLASFGPTERYMLSFIGVVIFVVGMTINISSDYYLVQLRCAKGSSRTAVKADPTVQQRKSHYKIPRSSLFARVSCPNLAGEFLEWIGYGLAVLGANGVVCGFGGLSFAFYTLSNLLPRALQHHRWYEETFGNEYRNLNRKAFFPFVL